MAGAARSTSRNGISPRTAEESAATVNEGEMAPSSYTLFTNSEARLTHAEKQALIDCFAATLRTSA